MDKIKAIFFRPTSSVFLQFFRYVNVGGIAFLGDWLMLYLLVHFGMHYLLSAACSFVIGLLINYKLSKTIVFQSETIKTSAFNEFLLYGVIGLIGLGLTEWILYFCTEELNIYFMVSKLIAAIIVLFWNFGARKYLLYFGRA